MTDSRTGQMRQYSMTKKFRSLLLLSFLLLPILALLTHCDDMGTGNQGNGEIFPDSGLGFSQHIRPIFLESCAVNSGCHIGTEPAAQLSLDVPFPTFLSRSGQVVVPFVATQSLLFQVIQGPSNGVPQMPNNRPALSSQRITAIGRWINEGAVLD